MRWVNVKLLQREFDLSPEACVAIIREQTMLVRNRPAGPRIFIGSLYLCAILLSLGAFDWLLPARSQAWELLPRILAVLLMAFSWFVLPRLLAGEAILEAARASAGLASAGASAS